jgi:diguanylate cyclase (GGDEF)-like protein
MLGEIGYESNGKISNMIGTIQDITEQKKVADELEYISYHDSLTGLSNRRKFEIVLENANSSGIFPVSIIMGDANGLKLVNDAFGHINGDNILVRIAQIMKEECGENACVARHGGDEFAAILEGVSYEKASLIVKRIINRCLDETTIDLMLNVSFGIGTKENENDDLKNCYHLAEEKMYATKILETKITRGEIIANLRMLMEEKTGVTQEQRGKIVELAQKFGEQLRMQSFEVQYLKQLVLWYDIGKTGVTDKIPLNQSKLPQEEQRILDNHCEIGYRIANTIPELVPIAEGILSHHERWDGDGYPHKLKDNDIPLMSRIVAILDTYITLTNDGAYRKALSVGEATEEIKKNSGMQFDPGLTKVFISKVLGQEW